MRALKVLILEDNSFQLMALHQMLNAAGVFDVLTAESVESARQSLANRGPIDVAICDLHLEAGDGLTLIRSLAEGQEAQALIILSSAEQEVLEGAAHMARQQGLHVLGCLRKPASAAALAELLASYQQRFARQRPGLPLAQVCELLSLHELQACAGASAIEKYATAHFQPKLTHDGRVAGVEVLPRWQHPEQGLLLPGSFMPVLEYAGLAQTLIWQVLEQAVSLSAEVRFATDEALPVTVSLPGNVLEQLDFSEQLKALLERFELPAERLTLEVLETAESSSVALTEGLLRLRMLGCQLSVGDFGLGGGSLQRLLERPFTELKITSPFVVGMAADARKSAIVAGALRMARGMNLQVVLSGVDSESDCLAAKALGDSLIQGDFVAVSMSRAQLLSWLEVAGFGPVYPLSGPLKYAAMNSVNL
ncbi:EAL domain-containing response regulator [Pseudomonas gingeri]|uniref:EAL domain-containing response regulator n=1 Tax=Pseudomonas gingeri TaxID=117681 RepID=A0A7Y7X717_9PSED|nr:EAL domain-containing response regulator [Pseudomonas gingeri]NWA23575.1 EAL domain-containing response regulator [Pseudomonas gingeri]NWB94478.1 EAL domain-containing response regulator [Pseudomonas gingeri]NWD68326.1 EAL domain-containing response regulator [Pseudomonas gingeri]NWD75918.1 EAL domain-containing response regulator [Pseudomonas gingeri]